MICDNCKCYLPLEQTIPTEKYMKEVEAKRKQIFPYCFCSKECLKTFYETNKERIKENR